jgi:hypothetical protein
LNMGVKPTNIFHPAEFWDLKPPNRPETSVDPKNCFFLALGDMPSSLCFMVRHVHTCVL